jgi:type III secretory pathway component EscS
MMTAATKIDEKTMTITVLLLLLLMMTTTTMKPWLSLPLPAMTTPLRNFH